jgi:purine nucleoside permease
MIGRLPMLAARVLVPAFGLLALAPGAPCADRTPVKVIVLAGFEVGDDTGDAPGEFQLWVERDRLVDRIRIPGADHPLCRNAEGLYGDVGSNTRDPQLTTIEESEMVMAICLDPRFDLRRTYWLIDGIAGIDPAAGSIGSAVWAENVVDGDSMREVDEADMPAGWPYGLFAIGTEGPSLAPSSKGGGWNGAKLDYSMLYPLNKGLAHWAYAVSKDVPLGDSPGLKALRAKYTGYPLAQVPPRVMLGDSLGSVRYWHGPRRTQWARDWVKYWTKGKGTFTTTSMEQQALVGTLTRMAAKGFVDINRVMVLRTASNYSMPPPGQSVISTIGDESTGTDASIEAAYRVGSAVAHELLRNWAAYGEKVPGS